MIFIIPCISFRLIIFHWDNRWNKFDDVLRNNEWDRACLYIITKSVCQSLRRWHEGQVTTSSLTKSFTFFRDRKWLWPSRLIYDVSINQFSAFSLCAFNMCIFQNLKNIKIFLFAFVLFFSHKFCFSSFAFPFLNLVTIYCSIKKLIARIIFSIKKKTVTSSKINLKIFTVADRDATGSINASNTRSDTRTQVAPKH